METRYVADQSFRNKSYTGTPLPVGEYEECVFVSCDFSGSDLSGRIFTDCRFEACNLSLANLAGAAFRDCTFRECKMLGLRWDTCNANGISVGFDRCDLSHSCFSKLPLKKTVFRQTLLKETDFSETDLSHSLLDDCELSGAVFDHSNLEHADFHTSVGMLIDPERNRMKNAVFSIYGLPGLLCRYSIKVVEA